MSSTPPPAPEFPAAGSTPGEVAGGAVGPAGAGPLAAGPPAFGAVGAGAAGCHAGVERPRGRALPVPGPPERAPTGAVGADCWDAAGGLPAAVLPPLFVVIDVMFAGIRLMRLNENTGFAIHGIRIPSH